MFHDLHVAIWPAGVIKKPRNIAVATGVSKPTAIDPETPDLALSQISPPALVGFAVVDELSRVRYDPTVLIDSLVREDTPSADR
jgi:hypothetical protein